VVDLGEKFWRDGRAGLVEVARGVVGPVNAHIPLGERLAFRDTFVVERLSGDALDVVDEGIGELIDVLAGCAMFGFDLRDGFEKSRVVDRSV